MTKGHPERGTHCDKQEQVTLAQVSDDSSKFGEKTDEFKQAVEKV